MKNSMKLRYLPVMVFLVLLTSACLSYKHYARPDLERSIAAQLRDYRSGKFSKDEKKRIAAVYKFAPLIRHDTRPCWWKAYKKNEASRSNFITNFDYDKDKRCNNNKDNLLKKYKNGNYYDLEATVYYAVTETETHRFITYHFYHAVDRSVYFPNILRLFNYSHENDGENIQLVIRKSQSGDYIEFLAIECHNSTKIYTPEYFDYLPLKTGKKIDKKVILTNCNKLNPGCDRGHTKIDNFSWQEYIKKYSHPAIYIGSGKHGITNDTGRSSRTRDIYFYPPLSPGTKNRFPTTWKNKDCKRYEYRLIPIYTTLWSMYINNRHLGNDGVLNGYFRFSDKKRGVTYQKVPRHYNSDYLSCVLMGCKTNAGILPFAFDLPGKLIKKGRLFFDPASNYKKYLKIDPELANWSERYVFNPYLPQAAW